MDQLKEKHEKRIELWNASIESHAKWIDKNTGMFDTKFTELRNCPVCNESKSTLMFNKEGGQYVKCPHCSMVYLNPVFKDEYLTSYYASNHSFQSDTVKSDIDFYNSIYGKGLLLAAPFYKSGAVLDIGCSAGAFLDLAKANGFQTYGIELNESESYLAKKKHTIFDCKVGEITPDIHFDLVTMWDVFEHIKDGVEMLNEISGKLKSNGAVLLQIPSSGSLAARILQKECNMFDGLEHVNLYNEKAIKVLAKKAGYQIIASQSVISESKVINNYLNYDSPYAGSFSSESLIYDEGSILRDGLGYKMQILLKKESL